MKRIKYWFIKNRYFFKDIKSGIKNLYSWFPIIWKDRDWDYHYLLVIQKHKLEKLHKNIFENFYDCPSNFERKKSLQALKICINILERKIDDWYFDTYSDLISTGDWDNMWEKVENSESYKIKDDWKISPDMELYNLKNKQAGSIEKRDWEVYNKLMTKYLFYWWD